MCFPKNVSELKPVCFETLADSVCVFRLHGSYAGLDGGQTMDAMVDLTGGLTERYDLGPDMYRLITRAHKSGAFIACSKRVLRSVSFTQQTIAILSNTFGSITLSVNNKEIFCMYLGNCF